jgi:YegS/Rv2252/BmrU family lipid kinase
MMYGKKVCLILDPHGGQNLAKLPDVLAVFSAAGWKTALAVKEYGGHPLKLAQKAAERGSDLLIAYGGDGTLNYVINGAMTAHYHGIVGLIPGGTANVWATEVGIPVDPVKAALTLVQSVPRLVDLGHVEVVEQTVSETSSPARQEATPQKQVGRRKGHATVKARQHFLLMAGLGVDAAVMGNVSEPLKYHLGSLAVGLAAVKELPGQRPFPIEISRMSGVHRHTLLWKGEARQVIIGNTRLYAKVLHMTPDASIDDGLLDVCVITAGDLLTTVQQILSLLLRRTPDQVAAEYFQSAHLAIRVPGSVPLQVDGSAVKLKDPSNPPGGAGLQRTETLDQQMVTYRFDALPHAVSAAIPREYDDTLFEHEPDPTRTSAQELTAKKEGAREAAGAEAPQRHQGEEIAQQQHGQAPGALAERAKLLLEQGLTIHLVGVSRHPTKKKHYILAGSSSSKQNGAVTPVAVRIDAETTIVTRSGEAVASAQILEWEEGKEIIVGGKKNKRDVIDATFLLL